MKETIKNFSKHVIFKSGFLKYYHSIINKWKLTVVMFHRVLSVNDSLWEESDLAWTLPDNIFNDCLIFFQKYYNVINLKDLIDAYDNNVPLPENPLLITFDDGWADNEEYALPLLEKKKMSAVIFVVANAINKRDGFWEERLYGALKTNKINNKVILQYLNPAFKVKSHNDSEDSFIREIINFIRKLSYEKRVDFLSYVNPLIPESSKASMLTNSQIKTLFSKGIEIGSHGATHEPLTMVNDKKEELLYSLNMIKEIISENPSDYKYCLSLPHGCYDNEVIELAYKIGYKFIFTSDPYLIDIPNGKFFRRTIGRIPIQYKSITDINGNFVPEKLAFSLMRRVSY